MYKILVGRPPEKKGDHLGYFGVDSSVILKSVVLKYCLRMWTGFIWLRIEPNMRNLLKMVSIV
jgi:hypothetical protein